MVKHQKISVLLLVIAVTAVALAPQQADIFFLIKKNFSIFSKTYENVALEYVDEVDPEKLMRTGVEAMLETLDPYTVIYNENQNEQAEIQARGNYAGIGIESGYRNGKVVVIAPLEGGPAEKAGLQAGDVIIAVDQFSTDGLQPEEVQSLTLGEEGSKVTITINRFGVDQPIDFELTRQRVEEKTVSYVTHVGEEENIGYVRLNQFNIGSANEVITAISSLEDERELSGLVLDLRDNPGGVLQEAVAIIDAFVEKGLMVVDMRGRIAEYNQTFTTTQPVLFEKPVVVLMNGGSASASEVVAGALQDLDRALIVGEQSFGKGLVQIVKPLPYNNSMKITIARYYIPSGRSIQSLEYTHEGANSGVVKRAPSGKIFKTKNGRVVEESRGIGPDVAVSGEQLDLLEIALIQKGLIFDFATELHARLGASEYERLPENSFDEFINYLEEKEFKYDNNAQSLLDNLSSEFEGSEEAEKALQKLKELNKQRNREALIKKKSFIENKLFLELIARTKGESGKYKAALTTDDQLNTAIQYIQSPEKIELTLSGEN
ncbi:S41 family peptidase [Balneola vulgaris]|uniref:S41 family peptidase n=1 Tax=Balneola vulgaris TaxID=287535 RepID=UPI0003761747|nr:S41 family peptidase [Balneola vulgaris]